MMSCDPGVAALSQNDIPTVAFKENYTLKSIRKSNVMVKNTALPS